MRNRFEGCLADCRRDRAYPHFPRGRARFGGRKDSESEEEEEEEEPSTWDYVRHALHAPPTRSCAISGRKTRQEIAIWGSCT